MDNPREAFVQEARDEAIKIIQRDKEHENNLTTASETNKSKKWYKRFWELITSSKEPLNEKERDDACIEEQRKKAKTF